MSNADLIRDIRETHEPCPSHDDEPDMCVACAPERYPCDAVRAADALEAATEPEWEYRANAEWHDRYDPRRHPHFYVGSRRPFTAEELSNPELFDAGSVNNLLDGAQLVNQERRRPAGEWHPLPVEGESA